MAISDITQEAVEAVLRDIRRGRRTSDSFLLRLNAVSARVAEDEGDAPEERFRVLHRLLRDLVTADILQATPSVKPFAGGNPPDVSAAIKRLTDERRWSVDLQANVALYLYNFAPQPWQQIEIARAFGLTSKTIQRRCNAGCRAIAVRLREVESASRLTREPEVGHGTGPHQLAEVRATYPSSAEPPPGINPSVGRALSRLRKQLLDPDLPQIPPDDLKSICNHRPRDLEEYCLVKAATWLATDRPYTERLVDMRLWRDTGAAPSAGAFVPTDTFFTSLDEALAEVDERLVMVVGAPGAGKTTLLRHLEFTAARQMIRGERQIAPHYVRLSTLQLPTEPAAASPLDWLEQLWELAFPASTWLPSIVRDGDLLLILDGLNEIPHGSMTAYRHHVIRWRNIAHTTLAAVPGTRIVFSCRTLDYTTLLSTEERRVPMLEVQPLADDRIQRFWEAHAGDAEPPPWPSIQDTSLMAVLRVPYYLNLLVSQTILGTLPTGRAGVLTGFVRHALVRELDRGNRFFDSGILTDQDCVRLGLAPAWRTEWELPEHGCLIPALSRLAMSAHRASLSQPDGTATLSYNQAIAVIAAPQADDVLGAGKSLGILRDDPGNDALEFSHLQMQEYFVARALSSSPQPELVAREWRADRRTPKLTQILATLHPAEELPPLEQTGWEEATLLAAEMANDPDTFITELAATHLGVAGRGAANPSVRIRLSARLVSDLSMRLIERSRERDADLRDRIECAQAAGILGDPRFDRRNGPCGDYLLPPLAPIGGGKYTIGEDEPIETAEGLQTGQHPRHLVQIAPFAIGTFPVTNAEYRYFVDGRGYDDERWWDTDVAEHWRRGQGVASARRAGAVDMLDFYRANPEALEKQQRDGIARESDVALVRHYLGMSKRELVDALVAMFPDEQPRAPGFWNDSRYNQQSQPVVGITWYEARAYCNWLTAQSGLPFRLPTEVEWEAAARGQEGRLYAYGNTFDPLACNTVETHLRKPTPVGVFPNGDTPEGVSDLSGNVWEWTISIWGEAQSEPAFGYPYRPDDGREHADAPAHMRRVVRGGSALTAAPSSRATFRGVTLPGLRVPPNGMRLACSME